MPHSKVPIIGKRHKHGCRSKKAVLIRYRLAARGICTPPGFMNIWNRGQQDWNRSPASIGALILYEPRNPIIDELVDTRRTIKQHQGGKSQCRMERRRLATQSISPGSPVLVDTDQPVNSPLRRDSIPHRVKEARRPVSSINSIQPPMIVPKTSRILALFDIDCRLF